MRRPTVIDSISYHEAVGEFKSMVAASFGKKEGSGYLERREKVRLESCHWTLYACG